MTDERNRYVVSSEFIVYTMEDLDTIDEDFRDAVTTVFDSKNVDWRRLYLRKLEGEE